MYVDQCRFDLGWVCWGGCGLARSPALAWACLKHFTWCRSAVCVLSLLLALTGLPWLVPLTAVMEQWQCKRAGRNMVGHSRPRLQTTNCYFHRILLAKANHMAEPNIKGWKNMIWHFVGKTAKTHAKGMETGRSRELGHLMQQTDHKRYRNRVFFAKTFNFRKHLLKYTGWVGRRGPILCYGYSGF